MKSSLTPRVLRALVAASALCSALAMAQAPKPKPTPFNATCVQVKRVNDGDTFVCVRSKGKPFEVRVAAVDAPETGDQRAADAGREKLRQIAVDGTRAACSGNRSGKRWVCLLSTPQKQDVGALLLEAGAAWYYTDYESELLPEDRIRYADLEAKARAARIGLWSDADPMEPWQCRRNKGAKKPCR